MCVCAVRNTMYSVEDAIKERILFVPPQRAFVEMRPREMGEMREGRISPPYTCSDTFRNGGAAEPRVCHFQAGGAAIAVSLHHRHRPISEGMSVGISTDVVALQRAHRCQRQRAITTTLFCHNFAHEIAPASERHRITI